jgi:adenine-specific DNA-methyltransferase
MSTILDQEYIRQTEQKRLDLLRTSRERNRLGQFATPPALALDIAKYAWENLKHKQETFRFIDPAIGTGSFYAAFLQTFPETSIESATGIELDRDFVESARTLWEPRGLRVIHGDFTRENPEEKFNVILTNPPYVRHHHLSVGDKQRLWEKAYKTTGLKLSGLAGLYCYFLLIAHSWLAENGFAAWLIPSEFMDVNYGEAIKRYLLEKVSLRQIHRFCPSDVQFDDALVSSAIVIFDKNSSKPDNSVIFSFGGSLSEPTHSDLVTLDQLRENTKWTSFPHLTGYQRRNKRIILGDLFTVKRGLATGNNSFFILPKSKLPEHGIPLSCVRPILPSPRFLKHEVIEADENGWPKNIEPLALIDCSLSEEEISNVFPAFWEYLRKGKDEKINLGYLTSRRLPWYSQEKRDVPPILCTYMGRSKERPFRFIRNKSNAVATNVYLLLYPKESIASILNAWPMLWEELFKSLQSIRAEEFFSEGRVYGGGLYKIEPAELMRLPADALAKLFNVQKSEQLVMF